MVMMYLLIIALIIDVEKAVEYAKTYSTESVSYII
jgi:hypothetical protein